MSKFLSAALVFAATAIVAYSQQPVSETEAISNYFKLDREGIHLHANKSAYLSGEKIWFKGYITKKQSQQPYFETTNVYVSLIGAQGQKVANVLVYAENATFSGYISLPKNLDGGVYYLQPYTNYLNNFSEDESNLYPVAVINPDSGEYFATNEINYSALDISIFPESGVFLSGTSNTIGFRIADCSGNGVPGVQAQVLNPSLKAIAAATTDHSGYARFDIGDTESGIYKIKAAIKGKDYEKPLPMPSASGISFSINNYIFQDKATVTVKTNKNTLSQIKGKTFRFAINQYAATTLANFVFDGSQTEQTLSIPASNFSDGLNTVYLIGENNEKIAERLVYKPSGSSKPTELELSQKRGDSIVIKGVSSLKFASLSVSVLPNLAEPLQTDIYSKIELSALANHPKIDGRHYFDGFNRKKHYELDNLLICQKSKYDWKKITGPAPVAKYDFDAGLTLKGQVNNANVDRASSKINLNAMAFGLNEFSNIDDKNEFKFERIMAEDSARIYFALMNKKMERTELKYAVQVSGNNRVYLKSFEPVAKSCVLKPVDWNVGFPSLKGGIVLDSVKIEAKAKPKLNAKNQGRFSNGMAKGYKIEKEDIAMYSTVVDFIQNHGYGVTQIGGRVVIARNYSTSFTAGNAPQIYVDDMLQEDHNLLTMYRMDMVDEIYINKRGYGGGLNASNGIIRIYLKKGAMSRPMKVYSRDFIVKGGFQKALEFENPHDDFRSESFKKLGAVHWIPEIYTDASGHFRFAFPNLYQDSVKVVIEGLSPDGSVTSEVRTIQIN